jgi:hypothetical protein
MQGPLRHKHIKRLLPFYILRHPGLCLVGVNQVDVQSPLPEFPVVDCLIAHFIEIVQRQPLYCAPLVRDFQYRATGCRLYGGL